MNARQPGCDSEALHSRDQSRPRQSQLCRRSTPSTDHPVGFTKSRDDMGAFGIGQSPDVARLSASRAAGASGSLSSVSVRVRGSIVSHVRVLPVVMITPRSITF